MGDRWLGISAASKDIILVGFEFEADGSIALLNDEKWGLHRDLTIPAAYNVMFERIKNYVVAEKFSKVVIQGTTVNPRSTGLSHLEAAQLRGVVIASAATAIGDVEIMSKITVSKKFGKRKTNEYVDDDSYWDKLIDDAKLNKYSRETAMMLLMARKNSGQL